MDYGIVEEGTFLERPNRFVADVMCGGQKRRVHVKNTGRCQELFVPGARVMLEYKEEGTRKTKYDLVMVHKPGLGWVNVDSQAPNRLVKEWLQAQGISRIWPEQRFHDSRLDFKFELDDQLVWMEVKGCTLEKEGIGYFPDAPTVRGTRHLRELIRARQEGCRAMAAFVIQMEGITQVRPNTERDPAFGAAWQDALEAGVEFLFLPCEVKKDRVRILPEVHLI